MVDFNVTEMSPCISEYSVSARVLEEQTDKATAHLTSSSMLDVLPGTSLIFSLPSEWQNLG